MPVESRLDWTVAQIASGRSAHISLGAARDDGKLKVKIILYETFDIQPIVRDYLLTVLQHIRGLLALGFVAVDRGHKHSSGRSEIGIWIQRVSIDSVEQFQNEYSVDAQKSNSIAMDTSTPLPRINLKSAWETLPDLAWEVVHARFEPKVSIEKTLGETISMSIPDVARVIYETEVEQRLSEEAEALVPYGGRDALATSSTSALPKKKAKRTKPELASTQDFAQLLLGPRRLPDGTFQVLLQNVREDLGEDRYIVIADEHTTESDIAAQLGFERVRIGMLQKIEGRKVIQTVDHYSSILRLAADHSIALLPIGLPS